MAPHPPLPSFLLLLLAFSSPIVSAWNISAPPHSPPWQNPYNIPPPTFLLCHGSSPSLTQLSSATAGLFKSYSFCLEYISSPTLSSLAEPIQHPSSNIPALVQPPSSLWPVTSVALCAKVVSATAPRAFYSSFTTYSPSLIPSQSSMLSPSLSPSNNDTSSS
ncbi:hypothetical protein L7F22_053774 [Adiantum nelumboides]|nr:hypothetical protein [Adiantum nelumboides]